jgi:malonate decarboxylase beta subunit
VVGVIGGMVGCFGGMSLAAALCNRLVMTRQARLGMNGPEVIEEEAGVEELDSRDRRLIWSMIGGEQRVAVGLADTLVEDDTDQVRDAVLAAFAAGVNKSNRTGQVDAQLERLGRVDPAAIDPVVLRSLWQGNA